MNLFNFLKFKSGFYSVWWQLSYTLYTAIHQLESRRWLRGEILAHLLLSDGRSICIWVPQCRRLRSPTVPSWSQKSTRFPWDPMIDVSNVRRCVDWMINRRFENLTHRLQTPPCCTWCAAHTRSELASTTRTPPHSASLTVSESP